jgi:putative holliday junction resolvase
MTKSQVYLSFDFGSKRIGTAVGQTLTGSARALKTITVGANFNPHWPDIAKLVKQYQPHGLVVGIPLNMDGSEQFISQKAREFAKQLQQQFSLPVYEVDERLTTKAAREILFAEGGIKALKSGQVDCVAAQLILQSFLATRG